VLLIFFGGLYELLDLLIYLYQQRKKKEQIVCEQASIPFFERKKENILQNENQLEQKTLILSVTGYLNTGW
jgi:hypothetical protein